jgi:hypothetical protein
LRQNLAPRQRSLLWCSHNRGASLRASPAPVVGQVTLHSKYSA